MLVGTSAIWDRDNKCYIVANEIANVRTDCRTWESWLLFSLNGKVASLKGRCAPVFSSFVLHIVCNSGLIKMLWWTTTTTNWKKEMNSTMIHNPKDNCYSFTRRVNNTTDWRLLHHPWHSKSFTRGEQCSEMF